MLNISSDVIRGYNDTIILYLLLDRPSYGYEISKQIRLISEEKYVIKETTLYSAFHPVIFSAGIGNLIVGPPFAACIVARRE